MRNCNAKVWLKFIIFFSELLQLNFQLKKMKSHQVEIPNKTEMANRVGMPYEVLELLINYIPNYVDRMSFKAVCKLWRLLESDHPAPPAELPWLMLTSSDGKRKFYEMCSRNYYADPIPKVDPRTIIGSYCDGWIFCHSDSPKRFFLNNVYSGEEHSLPLKTSLCFDPNPFEECTSETCERINMTRVNIDRTVFSCSPSSQDYLAASVSPRGCFLTITRPNSKNSPATTVHVGGAGLTAIIFYNNKLMGVDKSKTVYSFVIEKNARGLAQATSFHKPKMKKFDFPLPSFSNRSANDSLLTYLVQVSDKLLMVLRHHGDSGHENTCTVGFKVYELVWKCPMEWVEVKSLQGHAIFVDSCISRVFHASQFSGIKGDHIYFTTSYESFDTGVFSMREQSISCILPAEDFMSHSRTAWLFPPNCHTVHTHSSLFFFHLKFL
jgi:Protein of unknown function (DUF295)